MANFEAFHWGILDENKSIISEELSAKMITISPINYLQKKLIKMVVNIVNLIKVFPVDSFCEILFKWGILFNQNC